MPLTAETTGPFVFQATTAAAAGAELAENVGLTSSAYALAPTHAKTKTLNTPLAIVEPFTLSEDTTAQNLPA